MDNDHEPPQQRLTDTAYRLSLMLIALPLCFCDLQAYIRFTVSQAHEVHALICQSLTFSSTAQPFIWFSCFRISAPKIWNSLPAHILQSQTLSSYTTHYCQSSYPASSNLILLRLWRYIGLNNLPTFLLNPVHD